MTPKDNIVSDADAPDNLRYVEGDFQVRVFPYEPNRNAAICEHESAMHELCQNIMKQHNEDFKNHGYELEGALYWNEFGDWRRVYSDRIPYKDGYHCFFRIDVKKDGEYVSYDSGEDTLLADMIHFSEISYDGEELNARLIR